MEPNDVGIYTTIIAISSISLLGSFFNIFGFIYFKSIRCFALELVFYLSLSCMITYISLIMHSTNINDNE